MADIKLTAAAREDFGKGASRRLRRAGQVPAVVYGHGTEPVHISVDHHEVMLALRNSNALFDLQVTGGNSILAIAREVQRGALSRRVEHVDFVIVRRGEKVEVEVPLDVTGEAGPGTLVQHEEQALMVLADATKIPESLPVSIEGRAAGEHVYAADVTLPEGLELAADPELMLINISEEISEAALEAELGEDTEEEVEEEAVAEEE